MNNIYTIKNQRLVFLLFGLLAINFLNAEAIIGKQTAYYFVAKSEVHDLSWNRNNAAAVTVVIGENEPTGDLENATERLSSPEFKKGSKLNGGFVVYEGNENTIHITGLTEGTKYFVVIFETNSIGILADITNKVLTQVVNTDNETQKPNLPPPTVAAVVCPAVGGIVCTLNGSSTSGYSAGTAPCNTGAFAGANPWDGASCAGFISFTFSTPIKVATIKMIAVNTGGERTTVSASGGTGGTLSVSGLACMPATGLVLGPFTGTGFYGDVAATITSTGTFLTITCTNTGCQSGWVASCPTFLSVLPIELISFTGECSLENVVNLSWQTISETNNDFFTIERSSTTEDWNIVGRIDGAGNSNQINTYSFTDKERFNETMYYRIKQTDFNGEFKYSEIVAVHNCKVSSDILEGISMYPNPVSGDFFVTTEVGGVNLEIFSTLGLKVASFVLESGENKFDLSAIENGAYYAKLSDNDSHEKIKKLIINR